MKVSVVEREGQKLQLWRAAVAARGGWSASPLKARSAARKVSLNCLVSSDLCLHLGIIFDLTLVGSPGPKSMARGVTLRQARGRSHRRASPSPR